MYYPPDFDPKLVPRMKREKHFSCEVRMMLPFSVQCGKCGEFMYMGKKFNSKMENADGERFKGVQIKRFWIKCGTCSNQMTFKTDPENDDYQMESGGSRTFEMWQEVRCMVVVGAVNTQKEGEGTDRGGLPRDPYMWLRCCARASAERPVGVDCALLPVLADQRGSGR